MQRDASLMQLMCQRYFPERASVWASSGNHALDADDLNAAEGYFQRCLQLDPNWTAGLAGLAIVCERRKDWSAALPYRLRVLEVENARQRQDAASVQRKVRYAAALARLGRWREAEPWFRAALRSSALAQLPAEQPVLLRVFSQNLYAPQLVAALPTSTVEEPAVTLARHEAALIAQLSAAATGAWPAALCAYLSGELERAYELLDQAEVDRPDDLAVHYLLWRCASALDHPQTASIRAFAEQAARAAWAAQASQLQRDYALAILPELSASAPLTAAIEELEPVHGPALVQLERIVAFRALHEAAGHSPLIAAAASTHALAALAASDT
jgi:tetratricopeptide (TPR) repeat protein